MKADLHLRLIHAELWNVKLTLDHLEEECNYNPNEIIVKLDKGIKQCEEQMGELEKVENAKWN